MTRMLTALSLALALHGCAVSTRGVETPSSRMDETVRLEGTIARSDRLPPPQRQLEQVAVITLDTTGEKVKVVLAPTWYLEQHGFDLESEAPLAVTGRQGEQDGQRQVVASELERGEQRVQLRDAAGKPLWKERNAPDASGEDSVNDAATDAAQDDGND